MNSQNQKQCLSHFLVYVRMRICLKSRQSCVAGYFFQPEKKLFCSHITKIPAGWVILEGQGKNYTLEIRLPSPWISSHASRSCPNNRMSRKFDDDITILKADLPGFLWDMTCPISFLERGLRISGILHRNGRITTLFLILTPKKGLLWARKVHLFRDCVGWYVCKTLSKQYQHLLRFTHERMVRSYSISLGLGWRKRC